jgi:hypothetical protein
MSIELVSVVIQRREEGGKKADAEGIYTLFKLRRFC